jgi:opine dehydrogenase
LATRTMTRSRAGAPAGVRAASVAVIGAGAAGLCLAAMAARAGATVRIANRSAGALDAIRARGGISVAWADGQREIVSVALGTTDVEEAVAGSQLVVVAVSSGAEEAALSAALPALAGVDLVAVVSGRCGSALACRRWLLREGVDRVPPIAEFTLPFVASSQEPGRVTLDGEKVWVPVAYLESSGSASDAAKDLVAGLLPGLWEAPSVVWTSLHAVPGLVLPTIMICNAPRIDRGDEFALYREGVSPRVGELLELADQERMAVARAVGVQAMSAREWFQRAYGLEHQTLVGLLAENPHYAARRAPTTMQHRFLLEHVPAYVVALARLGDRVDVPTPLLDAIIALGSALAGRDLLGAGEALGSWISDVAVEDRANLV